MFWIIKNFYLFRPNKNDCCAKLTWKIPYSNGTLRIQFVQDSGSLKWSFRWIKRLWASMKDCLQRRQLCSLSKVLVRIYPKKWEIMKERREKQTVEIRETTKWIQTGRQAYEGRNPSLKKSIFLGGGGGLMSTRVIKQKQEIIKIF